jgi:hypothetical protein
VEAAKASVVEFFDSIQETEELVAKFTEFDITANAYVAPVARNPFAEDFASEEVVFDQYFQFEDQMLSVAPRVINRLDTAFAQQLRQCEIELASVEEPIHHQPVSHLALPRTKVEPAVATIAVEPEFADPAINYGDVLVVEDERPVAAAIVPSRNFRQLFSNLEAANRTQRCC